jgi:hypothetical protein
LVLIVIVVLLALETWNSAGLWLPPLQSAYMSWSPDFRCPAWVSVGDTTNDFDVDLAAHAGAESAAKAIAAVSATNAADILRMRSSLGEAADKGGRTR